MSGCALLLTQIARELDRTARVTCNRYGPCEQWLLEREGRDPVGLGSSENEAWRTLHDLIAERVD